MLSKIPVRPLLRAAAGLVGAMALVAVLGTAAARTGVFVPVDAVAAESTASSTNRPPDGDDGDDGSDGDDGRDGRNGRDGRDGQRGVYIERYITEYTARGGDRSRVSDGGQVAIYPSGGVATGA